MSTKINFEAPVILAGNEVPAGKYALYTIPNETTWTIIIHKNTNLWGAGGYNASDDLVRFSVPVSKTNDLQESLLIDFQNFKNDKANLVIAWERTKIEIPVHAPSDEMVYNDIKKKIIDFDGEISAATYFDAGLFYYEKNKDLKQALSWVDKAVTLKPNAFWYVYYQAEIANVVGNKDKALKSVNSALEMAKKSPSGGLRIYC